MASFNLNLRYKVKQNLKPIYLVIRYDKIEVKYHSKEHILIRDWNVKRQRSNCQVLNTKLDKLLLFAKETLRQYQLDNNFNNPTPKHLKELLNYRLNRVIKSNTVSNYIDSYIPNAKSRMSNVHGYLQLKTMLNKYDSSLSFNDIDMIFYYEFKRFLQSESLKLNTIGRYIKSLKTILRDAVDNDKSTNTIYLNKKFKVDKQSVESVYLNENELKLIYELDLPEYLENARDSFLIGCYTGLRYSDYTNIKLHNIVGDTLEIVTKKTSKKVLIPFNHYIVKEIREKYEDNENTLPRAISNTKLNEYIKIACSRLPSLCKMISMNGIKKPKYSYISSHTARRSFASNLVLRGIPIHNIMSITGHTKETSFLSYVKITPRESIQKVTDLFANIKK